MESLTVKSLISNNPLEPVALNLKFPIKPRTDIGAQGRLAIKQQIHVERFLGMDGLYGLEKMVEYTREEMRYQLSREVFDHIASRSNPVTVRITEKLENGNYTFENYVNVILIADLQDVEQMKSFYLPSFEFITRTYEDKPIMEWQCSYCGQVNLVIENLECRKCSAPRKVLR